MLALAACTNSGSAASPAPPPLQVDHVVHATGDTIADELGRTVILRGVNVNQLAEYAQNNPAFPTVEPLAEDDFARIAALGFDVVRLLVSWSRLEPAPGEFDLAYVARVREAVRRAHAHDLYVIVDMHQDAWGPAVGTPPGETCAPGFSPALGWDGAPPWATLTDGLPTCVAAGQRELSAAVAQAFSSFFADRDGIQSHLVQTWGRLAGALATEPGVAGWDLLNEANPGLETIGTSELVLLGLYYDHALDTIRAAEAAAGAPSHIGFFEPPGEWSSTGVTAVPAPGFTDQANLAFAPHRYAPISPSQSFDFAAHAASAYGVPYFWGEWGAYGDPATDAPGVARFAAEADARRIGDAWWSWKQACGDPHVIRDGGGHDPQAVSPSLVRIGCPGDVELGIPPEFAAVLSRAYPRAAPGTLTLLEPELASGGLHLRGSADRAGVAADLWVPERCVAPVVSGANLGPASAARVAGGWRIAVPVVAAGDYEVRVGCR